MVTSGASESGDDMLWLEQEGLNDSPQIEFQSSSPPDCVTLRTRAIWQELRVLVGSSFSLWGLLSLKKDLRIQIIEGDQRNISHLSPQQGPRYGYRNK